MIQLDDVSKKYGKDYALKNISLSFNKHETVAIIGSSGSGKSTLLKCINGLEIPTSGNVLIDGKKLTSKNSSKLCFKIGMVFQGFNLFPHMNILDNLTYAPMNVLGMSRVDAQTKANELLDKFNLKDKISSFPGNLSGGQKQRVAICRALMMNPEIMLFDEPTSALDPEVIKDVSDAILLLKASMSIIIVTHHIKFAKSLADRIVFMDHAIILADQPASEFFEKPKSHRARLFLENVRDL